MRALRHSINVTLDGCCDHRVTYEMMPNEVLPAMLSTLQRGRAAGRDSRDRLT